MFTGTKGTGKTVTAKELANKVEPSCYYRKGYGRP